MIPENVFGFNTIFYTGTGIIYITFTAAINEHYRFMQAHRFRFNIT